MADREGRVVTAPTDHTAAEDLLAQVRRTADLFASLKPINDPGSVGAGASDGAS